MCVCVCECVCVCVCVFACVARFFLLFFLWWGGGGRRFRNRKVFLAEGRTLSPETPMYLVFLKIYHSGHIVGHYLWNCDIPYAHSTRSLESGPQCLLA